MGIKNENKNENQNENQNNLFRQELKDELFAQTFQKDESEFSSEKIEHLVGLLELEHPTDEQEVMEAQRRFEEDFQKTHQKEIRNNRVRKYCRKIAGAAAVLMLTVMAADVTTKAVMDESLFHMVSRWTNQLEIIPSAGEENPEATNCAEGETKYFCSVDEFAEYFGDDFLVCSWLPEGVELEKIATLSKDEFSEIVFEYNDEEVHDWKLQVWIYQTNIEDTAGFVATSIKGDCYKEDYVNGRKVVYYRNNDGLIAGFDYQGWWYLLDISSFDEDVLTDLVERMIEYEATEK